MNLDIVFFQGWESIVSLLIIATVTYVAVAAFLRLAGVRALAKMSAYDLVVTIALGSLVATIPLNRSVSVSEGLTAIAAFLTLQYFTSLALQRWPQSRDVIKNPPQLLAWHGQLLRDRMKDARVTEEEIHAALRASGLGSLSQVFAVVLENDGSWSVVSHDKRGNMDAFGELDIPSSREAAPRVSEE